MANHHTVATEIKRSREQRDAWRERVEVGNVMERLERAFNGGEELTSNQIKAGEVLLDRLLPRLSAVEQTEVNELDQLSHEDILARISALLAADPTLLPELIARSARNSTTTPVIPKLASK